MGHDALRILSVFLLVLLPAATLAHGFGVGPHDLVDFRNVWWAGQDVLHGHSPYHVPRAGTGLTADCRLSAHDCYVYPPFIALVATPLSALPFAAAGAVYFAIMIAATALALRVLRVRDWRCYGLAFLSVPISSAITGGTITPLLMLGLALCWRFRNHALVAPIVAVLIVAKIFLWPVLVWLLVTRRWKDAIKAALCAAVLAALSWWWIGFSGLADYPHRLGAVARIWERNGYSPVSLALALGSSRPIAYLLATIAGGLALFAVARFGQGEQPEAIAFSLTITASLLLTPVVWLHYFSLLFVPISIVSPELSLAWMVPLGFVLFPGDSGGQALLIVCVLGISAALVFMTIKPALYRRKKGDRVLRLASTARG